MVDAGGCRGAYRAREGEAVGRKIADWVLFCQAAWYTLVLLTVGTLLLIRDRLN